MRKLISLLLTSVIIIGTALPVFAWTESDIVVNGGEEIIVPLQVPDFKIEPGFTIDESFADHNGEYGKVYRGKVDVSGEQKKTKLFSFNNYYVNEGKYKLSMWFMEDPDNSDILTRMIRPLDANGTTLKGDNGGYLLFFNSAGEKIVENGETVGVKYRADKEIRGVWKKYEIEFTVSSSQNSTWLGKPNITFSWECVGKYEDAGKKYTDKFINGDINVLFSDVKLFKYPSEDFAYISDNSGEPANEFRAEFSAPVDINSIESIKIDGMARDVDSLDIRNEDNTLVVAPAGGFAPGRSYNVSLSGITDIFERKYSDEIAGTVAVQDYLDVNYLGNADGNNSFSIKNNMKSEVNLIIAVFYYSGNSVKKVSYSPAGVVPAGEEITTSVPVLDGVSDFKAKAQIWNASMLPMPLATEIVLD